MISSELLKKYDVPVPRYTSYPTVPYWADSPSEQEWLQEVNRSLESNDALWGMYLHIPFCESLCTYCGCNTSITKDHTKEMSYVNFLLKEFSVYKKNVPLLGERALRQLHLGGGTPTFLTAEHLEVLMKGLLQNLNVDYKKFEGSIEVDPRRTKKEQLEVLREFGFNRVSMGVQDFDPEVQRLVNRIQPVEVTQKLTEEARELGYASVNYDLIYGLPKQTLETVKKTAEMTVKLRPDRIALYSLAIVPWIKPAQRLFKDEDLPQGAEKRALYELAREILTQNGYIEIGMDHFALPEDALNHALKDKTLHRNFMGYTEWRTDLLLGLGVSSISETDRCFHQNEKVLPMYEKKIQEGALATHRGHKLTSEDQFYREQILTLMTQFEIELNDLTQLNKVKEFLSPMVEDELVRFEGNKLVLTQKGRPFLRNACVAFDKRLRDKTPHTRIFSQAL